MGQRDERGEEESGTLKTEEVGTGQGMWVTSRSWKLPSVTAGKETGSQFYRHKELNSANSPNDPKEADSFLEPPVMNAALLTPRF